MTEAKPLSPATPDSTELKPRSCCRRKAKCVFILVLAFALLAGWYFCPWFLRLHTPVVSPDLAQMGQRLSTVEQKIQELDNKLNDLNIRVEKNTAPAVAESVVGKPETSGLSVTDAARMQSDLTSLSATVSGLQAEVKQAGMTVAQTQQAAHESLATVIAFVQLREAAASGRGFTTELAVLRAVAGNNSGLQETLGQLEPYAAKGAPVAAALRDEFLSLETPVSHALDKAAAQSWWERVLAELRELISIRHLHGDETADIFTAADSALAAGDDATALDAIKNLPVAAQDVLKDWRAKVEARQAIDTDLRVLADHLMALAVPAGSAPNARETP